MRNLKKQAYEIAQDKAFKSFLIMITAVIASLVGVFAIGYVIGTT